MSGQSPRTAAALEARRLRTQAKLDQVRLAIADLNKRNVPVTASAVVRRAGISRTFLYENPAARELVSEIIGHTTTHDPFDGCRDTTPDTTWRERALNAEDALKAAHIEIRGQRNRIAQLMGQIRDMETRWTDESISHITTENTNLKQRLRQLTQDTRAIDERLQAARSNSRFQDRRIAQLEAHLLEPGRLR